MPLLISPFTFRNDQFMQLLQHSLESIFWMYHTSYFERCLSTAQATYPDISYQLLSVKIHEFIDVANARLVSAIHSISKLIIKLQPK